MIPLALLAWLSPAFPVGAFSFSHGLEWAVGSGEVADAADLTGWLDDLLRHGAPRADAVLLALSFREPAEADAINELALALSASAERHLETAAQGNAFLAAVAAAWPLPALQGLASAYASQDIAYPIAVGLAARAHGLALADTLPAFGFAAAANLVSAALRLGIVGQSDAQLILAQAAPAIAELARFAEGAGLDDLGTCAWRSDIAAMRHETQYSRLFRS